MRLVKNHLLGGVALGLLILAAPAVTHGQQAADTLRRQMRLPQPATFAVAARGEWIAPGSSIGVPTGYGADYGDAFVGMGLQLRTRYRDAPDGGVVAGFGVGDAARLLGLEIAVTSFGTVRSCCRGGISTKLHRVLPANASIAVGVENAVVWGEMEGGGLPTDAGRSVYGALSKVFLLRADPAGPLGSMVLTAGAGNGRFRRESDILDDRERINPFFSGSVRVAEPASVIASWTGQDLVAGVSLVPFRNVPLYVTPAVADLTTNARLILGIGYGFNYTSLF